MKFYTIQKRSTWNKWKKQGHLEAYADCDPDFETAYKWMKEQMKKRLPNYKGEIPIWLWVNRPVEYRDWSNIPRKKFVLLTIELDKKDVLLSNFDVWHIPLYEMMNEDEENWEAEFDWEKVFDLEWCRNDFLDETTAEVIQATTGRIELNKVISVKSFTTKKVKYSF